MNCSAAKAESKCRFCLGLIVSEILPCCWRNSWMHLRCSRSVSPGKACASHSDVLNPLRKIIVARKDDNVMPLMVPPLMLCGNDRHAGSVMHGMVYLVPWINQHALRESKLFCCQALETSHRQLYKCSLHGKDGYCGTLLQWLKRKLTITNR